MSKGVSCVLSAGSPLSERGSLFLLGRDSDTFPHFFRDGMCREDKCFVSPRCDADTHTRCLTLSRVPMVHCVKRFHRCPVAG